MARKVDSWPFSVELSVELIYTGLIVWLFNILWRGIFYVGCVG